MRIWHDLVALPVVVLGLGLLPFLAFVFSLPVFTLRVLRCVASLLFFPPVLFFFIFIGALYVHMDERVLYMLVFIRCQST